MITLTAIPAVVLDSTVSPILYSYLLATDAPVEFQFERREAVITTAANQGGITRLTFEAGHNVVTGDSIGIYDVGTDRMLQATATLVSTNVFDTDLAWNSRYATDLEYVLSYTQRVNYYIEVWLKVNGVYQDATIKATPDTKGNITLDISMFLQSEVSGQKSGDYTDDSNQEPNQSGYFTLEYRERYNGDSNDWTEEGSTWYYIYAIRTKEQGANLYEYIMHDNGDGKFLNEFTEPIWTIGMPMDIQFWWPPWYDNMNAQIRQYDANNNLLDLTSVSLDNTAKGFVCTVKLNLDTVEENLSYMTITLVEV